MLVFYLSFGVIGIAFVLIAANFFNLRNHKEGTELMIKRAAIIRSGAKRFLRREYRVIVPACFIIGLLYTLFREAYSGVCFLFASTLTAIAVEIGMRAGAYGNVRTTNAARKTGAISRTMRIALMGGSVSGFSVPAFGLFGWIVVFLLSGGINRVEGHGLIAGMTTNSTTMRLAAYSLGCSVVAMFNRVAGSNFTKSADIAADNVGKGKHHLDEDDPRNVCTIADFVGDLVNDVAGNVSDLFESLMATPTACAIIAFQTFSNNDDLLFAACVYPIIMIAGGLLASLCSVMFIILKNRKKYKWVDMSAEEYDSKYAGHMMKPFYRVAEGNIRQVRMEESPVVEDPAAELNLATWLSAGFVALIGLYGAYIIFGDLNVEKFKLGWISPWIATICGIVSSVAVGMITERYTSTKYKHVEDMANLAPDGVAYMVSKGTSIGNISVLPECVVLALAMLISGKVAGAYGVAIAAVGMLSFVGTTVSIDAFGPIADNAGGLAESCGLSDLVRKITDKLDAIGNVTAAIGKGNAIGSAAFAVVALIIGYIGAMPTPDYTDPEIIISIIVGLILGVAVEKCFFGLLAKNTVIGAHKATAIAEEELDRPGVMEKTEEPRYNDAIEIVSDNGIGFMVTPSLLSVLAVVVAGFLFGQEVVLGLIVGMAVMAIAEAISKGNAGGARDNAKKKIELGEVPGCEKGSEAHIAAVANDTVGDIEKDVEGPCGDISAKSAATVATTLVEMFVQYRVF